MKFLLWLFAFCSVLFGEKIVLMTEEWAPYNYEKDGEVKGVSAEVIKAIQQKIGNSDPIEIQSWNRAYKSTEERQNNALFSTTRTKERENLFKWVGPIAENNSYFFKKKGNPLEVKTLEDAKKVNLIGAGSKTNADFITLKAQGFNNLSTLDTQSNPINLIVNGRVDLGGSNPLTAYFHLKKNNLPIDAIENTGLLVFSAPLYLAFNKNTDDKIINEWQKGLDELVQSGEFEKIKEAALKEAYKDFGIEPQ